MAQAVDKRGGTDKKNEIIAAAQKRFGLYGYKKTSMNEIAEDLSMSKALLYYYFPDKEHLYKAVVEIEVGDFKEQVSQKIKEESSPAILFREYAQLRLNNFRTMLNLNRFSREDLQEFRTVMQSTWKALHEFEKQTIIQILEAGKAQNIFELEDTNEVAELVLHLFKGIRLSMIKDKIIFYLEPEEFELLRKRNEMLLTIFIKGISK